MPSQDRCHKGVEGAMLTPMISRRFLLGLTSVFVPLLLFHQVNAKAGENDSQIFSEQQLNSMVQRQVEQILRDSEKRFGVTYTQADKEEAFQKMWNVTKSIINTESTK